MLAWALAVAIDAGVLQRDGYAQCAARAWRGVASVVAADGSVEGICQGGPIFPTAEEYKARPTAYEASACGGLGTLLSAAAAVRRADIV